METTLASTRKERLAQALRVNLRRRKTPAGKAAVAPSVSEEPSAENMLAEREAPPAVREALPPVREAPLAGREALLAGRAVLARREADELVIEGGVPLNGAIQISGAKNAALPLLIAALLTDEEMHFTNIPHVSDVLVLRELLALLGCETPDDPHAAQWRICAKTLAGTLAPYDILSRMRAGFWVIAPLLARCGEARVSLPGGCAIGARPVNLYEDALRAMGAEISLEEGYIHAAAPQGLRGAHIVFPQVSVGATHVSAMAAALATGETLIENAAREPEVTDLLHCLAEMGAEIDGIGTSRLRIRGSGGALLGGVSRAVPPDRIEAGTYAIAFAMSGGEGRLLGIHADLLASARDRLEEAGVEVREEADGLRIRRTRPCCRAVSLETAPWPGFPTDLQAQFMAMMCLADGRSLITESIFENRFMHVAELARMGADISLQRDRAEVRGVESLTGARVKATDLRASVSLVLAGLVAGGETRIREAHHLDRGFADLERKLSACGARIRRVREA